MKKPVVAVSYMYLVVQPFWVLLMKLFGVADIGNKVYVDLDEFKKVVEEVKSIQKYTGRK